MSLFDVHPDGKSITVAPKYRSVRTPVSPHILAGFMSDEKLKNSHSEFLHGAHFLPMPVHESPLMCLFFRRPWTARYVDSVKNISLLRTIVACFAITPNMPGVRPEQVKLARDAWIDDTSAMEQEMYQEVEKTQDVMAFVHIMERCTLRRIHLLETCLWRMFDEGFKGRIPLKECLTPEELPPLSATRATPENVAKLLCHYFDHKQHLFNVRMDRALPEDAPKREFVQYFDIEDMKTRIFEESQLYREYLDRRTAAEYFNFIKGC